MRQDAFVSLLEAALGERAALVEAYRGELRSAKGALRVELTCAGWLSPAEIAKIRKAIRLEIPELASVSLHPRCLAARESFARDCAAFEEDLFAFLYSSMPALQGMGESPRLQLEQDILRVCGASPAWQGVFHAQQGEQRLGQIVRQLFGLDVRVRVQDAETAGAQAANGGESASPVNDLPPGKATAQEEAKEVRTPIDDLPPWEAALQDDAKEIPPPEDDLPPWEAADAGAQKLLSPEDVSNPDIPARAQGEQDAPACPLPSAELLAKLPDFLPEAPVQAAQPAVDAPPADAPFAAPAAVSAPPGPAISSADYVFAKPEEGKYSAAGVGMPPDDKEAVVLGKPITTACVDISEIREEIPSVTFQGEIIEATDETFKNGSRAVVRMAVTDYTSTISVRLYCDGDRLSRYARMLTPGRHVRVQGKARTNTTPRGEVEVFVDVRHLTLLPTPKRTDDAPEKRVELHLHTQMSSMDGMTNLKKVVQTAHDWGHGALAITDHGVVQTYPDALALTKKYPDFKVIYGLEAYLVDDTVELVEQADDRPLTDPIVVFDLETTGLNPVLETIIEIGAVKVQDGEVVDVFQTMVDPRRPIGAHITRLTGINDSMVAGAPILDDALRDFVAFSEGCVLCAHNASFDMAFIRHHGAQRGYQFNEPVIDTLRLARTMFPKLKNHKLDTVAAHLRIDMGSHHRAKDDARTAAGILFAGLEQMQSRGAATLRQANSALGKAQGQIRALPIRHATILVQSQIGMKNLYNLVTASHLEYFHYKPRIPKSLLLKHREGLLIGSACSQGEVYRAVADGEPDDRLDAIGSFYDYLEIQPIANNLYMTVERPNLTKEMLMDYNRRIIQLGKRLGIPVVATGDVHHLEEKDAELRRILLNSMNYKNVETQPSLHFRTTQEMLDEFAYLDAEQAMEVVVRAPRRIADSIEDVTPFAFSDFYPPQLDGAEDAVRKSTMDKAVERYGDPLPEIVTKRLDKELGSIISNGYAVLYYIAQQLVAKSMSDGYLVGSRGSVGSSLVATFMGITEVNPLPPHYVCPHCHYSDFTIDSSVVGCGHDLPAKACPNCGQSLEKDGYDIPFEVFLGFKGNKIPDIDLNFSGEYQPVAHKFIEELFGKGHVFRAGTISTVKERTAVRFVQEYAEAFQKNYSALEVNRLAAGIAGVKRTTGQHPGGIIIVPKDRDMLDFCPLQHPADSRESAIITTHFDFHSIDSQLVKLDILGHDDPSMLRMLHDLTGFDPQKVPMDDPDTMALFTSLQPLGLDPKAVGSEVGTMGLPEFGTPATRRMVEELRPTTQAELVRISGLSHGEGIWVGNARDLVMSGSATIKQAICTRDDIMNQLIQQGMEPLPAFKIMESVRKGKGLSEQDEALMRQCHVPDWMIDSCKKIKYMFPKAHAAAYVMMGFRIGYYKVHYPLEYYATYFTVRADEFDSQTMLCDVPELRKRIADLSARRFKLAARESNILTILEIVYEMALRGFKFLPVDVHKSQAVRFRIENGAIRPPLASLPSVGENAAISIVKAREEKPFISIEDMRQRAHVSRAVVEVLEKNGCLQGMAQTNQLSLF